MDNLQAPQIQMSPEAYAQYVNLAPAAPATMTTGQIEPREDDNRIVLPASTAAAISDTVVLFELDGREFRVPAKPRVTVALRYLRTVRDKGTDVAAASLLTELLGVDGFDALCEYEDLTVDQFKSIMDAAQKLTMGAIEKAFGGNSPGSKR